MGRKINNLLLEFARLHRFLMRFFREVVSPPFEFKEIIRQCYEVGWKSFPLISLTGFIVGFVFTKQSRPSLEEFGATSWLPALISIAIVRALAPLVTALIASGKVGSQIGAELSSMNVTEQIDAMEVSGTNPFKFLIASRILATTIMIPVLCFYVAGIGLFGGYLSITAKDDLSLLSFFTQVFESIQMIDLFAMVLRAVVFGFTIGFASCYVGYYSSKGTEGVGKAANSAVVASMFIVFIEELLIVQLLGFITPLIS
ncbi:MULTISPECIES: MlaE family ABC transporter permease [Sphingobacterium]|jgi:phospholipid/cholesterol/gamma-HCH transport system permease protein|uniref:ABC transporter permease n=1 Tax=Sphingobacterium litopenaei TaxID=2763500 RepID=A0ABR7YCI3_9SPHI|nr:MULTISPECIES: ABC transporter permease [Sphingobacterium]MBD1429018.1 ABC transporter permease [Sphingobacterium litopenaei]NGM72366.1 ABC transporter permease [Sphingobacterium sp. SGL-16]